MNEPLTIDSLIPCPKCKSLTPVREFLRTKDKTFRNECRACKAKKERASLKRRVFAGYGNKCACCGETIASFLVLDHVNNDGGKERKELNMACHQTYQKAIRENFPPIYQLLCASCNLGKQIHGICPHQTEIVNLLSEC